MNHSMAKFSPNGPSFGTPDPEAFSNSDFFQTLNRHLVKGLGPLNPGSSFSEKKTRFGHAQYFSATTRSILDLNSSNESP